VNAPCGQSDVVVKVSAGSGDPYTLPCPLSGVIVTGFGVMANVTTAAERLSE
jgi:hypothetical protein